MTGSDRRHDFIGAFFRPALRDRIETYVARGDTRPFRVDLDLTTQCNYGCPHCGDLARGLLNRGGMPLPMVERLVGDLAKLGVTEVSLIGGGEPTASPVFDEAVRMLARAGMQIGLTTNGSLMPPSRVTLIAETCAWVRISLDAATPAVYDRVHRPEGAVTFAQVCENLAALCRAMPGRAGVAFLIMKANAHEVAAAAHLVRSLGAAYIRYRQVQHPVTGRYLPVADAAAVKQHLADAQALAGPGFAVSLGETLEAQLDTGVWAGQPKPYRRCHAQAFSPTIAGDGKVYVCSKWRGAAWACIGDLREEPMTAIWRGRRRQEVLARLDPAIACADVYCHAHPHNTVLEEMRAGRALESGHKACAAAPGPCVRLE